MKYLFLIFVLVAMAFASDNGCTETSLSIAPGVSGTDAVSLTLIYDRVLTDLAYGLDIWENGTTLWLMAVDNTSHMVRVFDEAGAPYATLPLDAENGSCFGVAWNNNIDTETYYTNDWTDGVLYYTENYGSSWTTEANPSGGTARGMDFDGTDYWCTNGGGGGLWRFQPGAGQENIAIPEVTMQPSGLAVFPYGSNLGIAVTTYMTHNIYFYEWDGSTMSFLGSAPCPVYCSNSMGLTYSELTGNLYWGYIASNVSHIVEMSFTITATALERSSWGSIKTSF